MKGSSLKCTSDDGMSWELHWDDDEAGWVTLYIYTGPNYVGPEKLAMRLNPASQNILAAALDGP